MNLIRTEYDETYFDRPLGRTRRGSQRDKARLKEVLVYKQGGKLLEIGCGAGGFLSLAGHHFDAKGVDISAYATHLSRWACGAPVTNGDIERLKLPSDWYDVIAAFGVLEHLRRSRSTVYKLHDALADGGILIGSVPNNSGLVGRLSTAVTNFMDLTHCSTYSPQRWHGLFEEVGFDQILFFGEVTLTSNRSLYVRGDHWSSISFNLMFVCEK